MKILNFNEEKNNNKKKEEIVKLYRGKVVRITFSDKESVGLKESIVEILTNYQLTHPTTGYDVDPENGYDYVDDYYDADNASAVISVFDEIVANIAISAPQVPTEIKGTDPMTDGYLTYTDPIGEYMEVKDVKAIIYAGQTFTAKSKTVSGNKTVYSFTGEVHSAVYGNQNIKDIIIEVEEIGSKQTLVVKIPASVIPLRVNEVLLNADGSIKTHTNNGALPARIVYSVGLKSEITKEADIGVVYIDKSKLSAEYLAVNTNADGTINFYSNEYTNPHLINGSTVGDTAVEFEPSHTNGFYYILEDMPIYKDAEFKNQVTASEGIEDNTVYYYKDEYYHGNTVEVDAIERTGAQLKKTEIKTGTDGYLYRAAGSPRLNRILKFEGTKKFNKTNTAEDFYAPEFHYADGSTNAYDGKFIVHLGNNGMLTMVAGGDLKISKTVNAGVGLTAPDKSFEFTIDLDGSNVNNGTYNYVIADAKGEKISEGILSASNTKISLKEGQTATVLSLPPETEYTVSEAATDGFTAEAEGASGKIVAGYTYDDTVYTVTVTDQGKGQLQAKVDGIGTAEAPSVKFVNKYVPESVDVVLGADGKLLKEIEGRKLNADEFIFAVLDSENKEIATAKNNKNGTFEFTINFTKAGVYNYTIVEKNNDVAGVTYDESIYGVEITIVDKDGHLEAGDVVYTLKDKAVEKVVFSNTYKADETDITLGAIKKLTGRELNDGEFRFVLKDKDGKIIATAANTKDGKILFDKIILSDAGTYTYTVYEETGVLENITYDKTEYVVEVTVTDDGKGKLTASAPVIKKAGGDMVSEIIFENIYTVPTTPDVTDTPAYPQTGDNTNLALWFALLFISGGGIIGTAAYSKKRKQD